MGALTKNLIHNELDTRADDMGERKFVSQISVTKLESHYCTYYKVIIKVFSC